MVKIKPVKRTSLVDTVVERLRAVIRDGHLGPGDRLPTEADLIKQLEVSRTVLREAVGRLEAMGLVNVRGPRGMFVGDPGSVLSCVQLVRSAMSVSPRELVRFTEFRRAIECDAVRSAATHATPEDLAELKTLCEELRRPDLDDATAFQIDHRFHRKLLDLSGNEVMRNVMDVVREFVMASIIEAAPYKREPEKSYRYHRAIFDAVRAGDPDAAERAMRKHLDDVIGALRDAEERQKNLPSVG
jgi:GntR family transcriptional repressor for pyruvate dehydrogenase complex